MKTLQSGTLTPGRLPKQGGRTQRLASHRTWITLEQSVWKEIGAAYTPEEPRGDAEPIWEAQDEDEKKQIAADTNEDRRGNRSARSTGSGQRQHSGELPSGF